MDIRPLHTEDDYRAALAEVSALVDMDPKPGTPEGNRLEVLSILVEHYEGLMETAHLLRSPADSKDCVCADDFRNEVLQGLKEADDPSTEWVSHDQVKADMAAQRAALQRRNTPTK